CGFRVETEREGVIDFVLFFGERVGAPIRTLFRSLFESFLARRDLAIQRFEPVFCRNDHRLNRAVIREQLAAGNEHAFCAQCGERVDLPSQDGPIRLTEGQAETLSSERRVAVLRSRFEEAIYRLMAFANQEGLKAPECFISYAWGVPKH